MPRTRIKFCGMTRVEDALAAAELGADAVGMVLHAKSKRLIDRKMAKEIIAALPPMVTPVGLFADVSVEVILDFAGDLNLRHIQLHGEEPAEIVAQLPKKWVIKAVKVDAKSLAEKLKIWKTVKNLAAILLDSGAGSGIVNDWETIAQHQSCGTFLNLPPIIAAGGLKPDNVAAVVKNLRPWAVDVSSGIESSPGIKSRELMAEFVAAVRSADE